MASILVTAGPIPAKLDSVKFVTNRFKGGLALKTAQKLAELGHTVTLLCWKHSDLKSALPTIYVEDVLDYYQKVLNFQADGYILAAAVANLMPSTPYEGKFPSHQYHVGEKFSIQFEIAPRVIDQIKQRYPKAVLVGYKLFDGSTEELIQAGQKTLFESKANLVFANHPAWAKEYKIALTNDGSTFKVSFEEHVELIDKLMKEQWYRTEIVPNLTTTISFAEQEIIENYPKSQILNYVFGSFAIRRTEGFLTTTRGKRLGEKAIAVVQKVDHVKRIVYSSTKASLNVPLLDLLFQFNPQIRYLLHGHDLIGKLYHRSYEFPGTIGDLINAIPQETNSFILQLQHHGYLAGFATLNEVNKFLSTESSDDAKNL